MDAVKIDYKKFDDQMGGLLVNYAELIDEETEHCSYSLQITNKGYVIVLQTTKNVEPLLYVNEVKSTPTSLTVDAYTLGWKNMTFSGAILEQLIEKANGIIETAKNDPKVRKRFNIQEQ